MRLYYLLKVTSEVVRDGYQTHDVRITLTTTPQAADITGKWGCFLQKWEKYIEYK
jgi:hypothetical protein